MPLEIRTELLWHARLVLDVPQAVGMTPHGNRQIIRVVSGTVEGPKMKAQTLNMSGDWLLLRADGVGELDVRSTMQTDDGHLIYMYYRGLMHGTPEVMQRMFQGEPIPYSDLYFRSGIFFETGSEKYAWLNKLIAVGTGQVAMPNLDVTAYTIL